MPKASTIDITPIACQNYRYLLSTWHSDESAAASYFSGFFATLNTYNIVYPPEITENLHTRAIWAIRQILFSSSQPKSYILPFPNTTMDEDEEIEKARQIVDKLQYSETFAKRFIVGAATEPEVAGPHRLPSVAYYDPEHPNVIYDDYGKSSLPAEHQPRLKMVRILRAEFDGDVDFIIRSDDDIMMQALRERICL